VTEVLALVDRRAAAVAEPPLGAPLGLLLAKLNQTSRVHCRL
jgi:hypothetical protein